MVNFSGNNLQYLNSETVEQPPGRRDRYRTTHVFKDLHVNRFYRFLQYTQTREEVFKLELGARYVVTGKVNIQGYMTFLILETWKVDAKNSQPSDNLLKREVAE